MNIFSFFKSFNEREIERLTDTVHKINALDYTSYTAQDFQSMTNSLKQQHQNNIEQVRIISFALVKEAINRVLGLYLYDVQLMGGLVLDEGRIAEMATGEGKTLVATLSAYFNALKGQGVHVITANDYLVKRDATYLEPLYRYLGLSVGFVTGASSNFERKQAYNCDITYVTSSEIGFDYLRDNTSDLKQKQVLPARLFYAIVDEIDYLLIDEASTPLVLSGIDEEATNYYEIFTSFVKNLRQEDVYVNRKEQIVHLEKSGYHKLEEFVVNKCLCNQARDLYNEQVSLFYYINACLKAQFIFLAERDYLVRGNEIQIVSSKTGRIMKGRRWSYGIHQAIEAKEKCPVRPESITLASITIQNFFTLYHKLCGMTGTAQTQATEFQQIYNLDIVTIPTHKPLIRKDYPDKLFITEQKKLEFIVTMVKECQKRLQPVLIGCSVIETSERLSSLLAHAGIKHAVLNAKHIENEAKIIANAGSPGMVTIATNMAGRGTDIILGGSQDERSKTEFQKKRQQVLKAGGLRVIVAERHKSRRIDNQLKGRSARQGDPGECIFLLSLEDEFLTLFGGQSFIDLKNSISEEDIKDGELEVPFLDNVISYAQEQIELKEFSDRKNWIEYDDVINRQRLLVYRERQKIIDSTDIDVLNQILTNFVAEYFRSRVDNKAEVTAAIQDLNLEDITTLYQITTLPELKQTIQHLISDRDIERSFDMEKRIILSYFNQYWKEYINSVDLTRRVTNLVSFGQRDPKVEFKKKMFEQFLHMVQQIAFESLRTVTPVLVQRKLVNQVYDKIQ